jgi:hypothetical protein
VRDGSRGKKVWVRGTDLVRDGSRGRKARLRDTDLGIDGMRGRMVRVGYRSHERWEQREEVW